MESLMGQEFDALRAIDHGHARQCQGPPFR